MTTHATNDTLWRPAEPSGGVAEVIPVHAAASREERGDAPLLASVRRWLARAGIGLFDTLLLAGVAAGALIFTAIGVVAAIAAAPGAAEWASRLVSEERGLTAAAALLGASLAMAGAVAAARRGSRLWVRLLLAASVLGGMGFLATLALDYEALARRGLAPGEGFRPNERWVARRHGVRLPPPHPTQGALPSAPASLAPPQRPVDAVYGATLFQNTCASCHGRFGEGMPGQGKDLRMSEFVAGTDDAELLKFLIAGRQPWDPANTTKVAMPGRGGNPLLKDDDLKDIVAYLRELQKTAPQAAQATEGADVVGAAEDAETEAAIAAAPEAPSHPVIPDGVPRSVIPPAAAPPPGLSAAAIEEIRRPDWMPPRNAQSFFAGYFLATAVAAAYAAAAALAGAVLLVAAFRVGEVGVLRAPIFLAALVCWGVTAFWLTLGPLLCSAW